MKNEMTVLGDDELAAVSGAKGWEGRMVAPGFPAGYVDNSKHTNQVIVVDGNTFIERGPGSLNVTIGGQSASS